MSASEAIAVDLTERTVVGKGLGALRAQGHVPAVIHDHGKQSMHVMGDLAVLSKTFQKAGKHHPVQLKVGNKQHLAMIKDVDVEPVKNRIRHIVFQAIKQNETVEAEVPLHLVGEIPAERAGLMVLKQLDSVMIEALPKDLVDELTVDATVLAAVGDALTVADIKVPSGVVITDDPTHQIAIVEEPRVQVEEAPVETEASAADVPSDHGGSATEA